jgi:hypothetical protein
MEQMHPFNWDIENPNAIHYGNYYWGVLLNDGRYIYLNADKAVISNTGDLILMRMRNYKLTKAEEKAKDEATAYMEKLEDYPEALWRPHSDKWEKLVEKENEFVMEPTMVLSSGHWVSYFAASFENGAPVSLDNCVKYTEETE